MKDLKKEAEENEAQIFCKEEGFEFIYYGHDKNDVESSFIVKGEIYQAMIAFADKRVKEKIEELLPSDEEIPDIAKKHLSFIGFLFNA